MRQFRFDFFREIMNTSKMFGFGKEFTKGFWAPWRALRMIVRSPRMFTLVAIPLAINIALYAVFFHYSTDYLDSVVNGWLEQMTQSMPLWFITISRYGLKIISWLILGLVAALTFTVVSGIVSAPFNDHLSRAALKARLYELGTTLPGPPTNLTMGQTIVLELKRMTILIGVTVFALLMGLIPLMQLPALAIGAAVVSFEYFGYPISQRSARLGTVIWFTLRHPGLSLGLGTFLLLMMALPFTSVLYIPLAVVAGTTLYVDNIVGVKPQA